jgi:hypothetical protein
MPPSPTEPECQFCITPAGRVRPVGIAEPSRPIRCGARVLILRHRGKDWRNALRGYQPREDHYGPGVQPMRRGVPNDPCALAWTSVRLDSPTTTTTSVFIDRVGHSPSFWSLPGPMIAVLLVVACSSSWPWRRTSHAVAIRRADRSRPLARHDRVQAVMVERTVRHGLKFARCSRPEASP